MTKLREDEVQNSDDEQTEHSPGYVPDKSKIHKVIREVKDIAHSNMVFFLKFNIFYIQRYL